MFTLKFEVDPRGSESGVDAYVLSAESYRVKRSNGFGSVDVIIHMDGTDITHRISHDLGDYQRCYVMNANGATIDKITP